MHGKMIDESTDSNDSNLLTTMPKSGAGKRIRKLQIKWTSQQTEKLIEKVFAREHLWNSTLKVGDDRLLRKSLWEQVAKEMEMSRSEITTKWNSVRSSFRSAFIKKEVAIRNGQHVKRASNRFYNSLRFLEADMHIDESTVKSFQKNRLTSLKLPFSLKSEIDSSDVSRASSVTSLSSIPSLCIKSGIDYTQGGDPLEPRPSSSRLIISPLPPATPPSPTSLSARQPRAAPQPPPPSTRSILKLQKRQSRIKQNDVKYNKILDLALEAMSAVSSKSDIWENIGSFVASNGREWATANPKIANEYKSAIYKTIADFQQKVTDAEV